MSKKNHFEAREEPDSGFLQGVLGWFGRVFSPDPNILDTDYVEWNEDEGRYTPRNFNRDKDLS